MPKTLRTHRDDDAPEDEQSEFDRALVMKHVNQLIEHFGSVRIFVVREDTANDVTRSFSRGRGNYYAQAASVREWLLQQDEAMKKQVWDDD